MADVGKKSQTVISYSLVEAVDLDQIESAVKWFESQIEGKKDVLNDDLMLRAAKKLNNTPIQIRQLAYQTFVGRQQVIAYLPSLSNGYFTKSGLEQRTHPVIANYRASFFSDDDVVIEIGCGLGFDTAAIANKVKQVICFEKDPVHATFAKYNLGLQDINNVEIICDDFQNINNYTDKINLVSAVYADPSRRTSQGGKVKNVADYSPPLDSVLDFAGRFDTASIKVSPIHKDDHSGFVSEWIGFDRECKERIIWKSDKIGRSDKVTIVDSNLKHSSFHLKDNQTDVSFVDSLEQLDNGYILFPHAALLASGRSEYFASQNNMAIFPPSTKLFHSVVKPAESPFIHSFKILEVIPFDEKKLMTKIESLGWNANTELKKKNFPIEPESFRSKLQLPAHSKESTEFGTVIFTQFNKQQIMVFAKRQ